MQFYGTFYDFHVSSTAVKPVWYKYSVNSKQDGRLAPAYFSQEHKYFDQHLPTVKNELKLKTLGNTSVYQKISGSLRRGYHETPLKNFCLTVPIKFVGEPFCVSKEFRYRKVSSKGGGSFTVLSKFFFISEDRKNFAREPFCVSENFW